MWTAGKLTVLGFLLMVQLFTASLSCNTGFQAPDCTDIDECQTPGLCGNHSRCFNNNGSYHCECLTGFKSTELKFTAASHDQCKDINECRTGTPCGLNEKCKNTLGSYECPCLSGFNKTDDIDSICEDIEECLLNPQICGPKEGGTCHNLFGSYRCECLRGYRNYGHNLSRCSELTCEQFQEEGSLGQSMAGLADLFSLIRNNCLALTNPNSTAGTVTGEALLENLFRTTDDLVTPGPHGSGAALGGLLGKVESALKFIGPQLRNNHTRVTNHTVVELAVRREQTPPTGPLLLTNEDASLNTSWEVATGRVDTYPGYTLVALVTYKNLEREQSFNSSFENVGGADQDQDQDKDQDQDQDPNYQLISKVVTAVVSNPDTGQLAQSVAISLRHLQEGEESKYRKYACVFWEQGGAWSRRGCSSVSNATHTVCTCTHLSSFAVLMALYPIEDTLELRVLTRLGLSLSLICLACCIATFLFCRPIQGTRTTIHLNLCICLFLADLVFLLGISRTQPRGGCSLVAGLLHLFFLGSFSWMLLEGVHLYRMVVLVFNASIRPLYLHAAGYGLPLLIVTVSAIARPGGYGTDRHCWLSLKDNLIWSFYGPVCAIIIVNVFFFIITVWKLAQKFSSLNPDLSSLRKIKTFSVTAVAQLCVLGLMWVFGAFLFQDHGSPALLYLFTILNSLQGALLFTMHCLLSKQVREEYRKLLSVVCTPQKKRYSDFSTNRSSQSQASKSAQNTGSAQV